MFVYAARGLNLYFQFKCFYKSLVGFAPKSLRLAAQEIIMYSPQPTEANNKKMGYSDQYKISSSDPNCQLRFGPIHDFIDVRVAILIETTRPVIDQRKNQPTETRNIFAYLVFVNIVINLKISEKKENSIHAGIHWLRLQKKLFKIFEVAKFIRLKQLISA